MSDTISEVYDLCVLKSLPTLRFSPLLPPININERGAHYGRSNQNKQERHILDFKSELICALIEARQEAGETQVSLGAKINMKQPMIARIEREISDPKLTTLIKLLDSLGKKIQIVDQNKKVI